jgi:hypothetical protein
VDGMKRKSEKKYQILYWTTNIYIEVEALALSATRYIEGGS